MGKDKVQVTLRISKSLHKALRHQSIDEERPVQAIIEDLVRQYLKKKGRLKAVSRKAAR